MGIQPIDLQTMYQQLSNVSKTITAAQQGQLTEAMQQQSNIQKKLEQNTKVQQTSNDKAKANNVNQNGSNGSSFYGSSNNKKKEQNNEKDNQPVKPMKTDSDYLGTIIDITR